MIAALIVIVFWGTVIAAIAVVQTAKPGAWSRFRGVMRLRRRRDTVRPLSSAWLVRDLARKEKRS